MDRTRSIAGVALAVGVAVLATIALGACSRAVSPSASPSTGARVVATVNGHPVKSADVELVQAEKRLSGESSGAAAALAESIDRELVRQEAAKVGVTADAGTVRARLRALTQQLGGDDALSAALQRARMTRAQLERSLSDGVLRQALQDRLFRALVAADTAVRAYYEKHRRDVFTRPASVHLGIIVVRARMIGDNALARLRAGHPFKEVAGQFSIDLESKANGGDIGLVLASSLPGPLRKAVAATPVGGVGGPLPAAGRWYVYEVKGRRPARVLPFTRVRGQLRRDLTAAKRSRALERWLADQRKRADIVRL